MRRRDELKALSPCSSFLVRFKVAGSDRSKMACVLLDRCWSISGDVVHHARGEGLLRMVPTVHADQRFEPRDPDTSSGRRGPRRHVAVWLFRNWYWQFESPRSANESRSLESLRSSHRNSALLRLHLTVPKGMRLHEGRGLMKRPFEADPASRPLAGPSLFVA